MNGTLAASVMRMSRSAIISAWRSSSIAHGPPMSARGMPPPIATLATLTTRVGAITEEISGRVLLAGSAILVLEGGFDEGCEQRVRLPRPRAELGVELAGDEEGVVRQLDDLHELLLGPDARNAKPSLLERVEVVVVHLVA